MRSFHRQQAQDITRPQLRPIPAWFWMLVAVIAVSVTALVVTIWLLAIANHANPGTDQANARLDAVRTGLAAGAGAGAAVGLMLAFRRQHHQEIATVQTDHDATERRITELYTKAVEQLGSNKAPVRLGGLYALERLAQDNEPQRQTIVNVICAYLRMPFPPEPPAGVSAPNSTGKANEVSTGTMTHPGADADAWQQEKQVRLTAQRILSDHLRKPDERRASHSATRFWDQISLDLTGATLIDFNLTSSKVAGDARFDGATFTGSAEFDKVTFSGDAWLDKATFIGNADFEGATFGDFTGFGGATFSGGARFVRATFSFHSKFVWATFVGYARFDHVTFAGDADFDHVTFAGGADFEGATFACNVRFGGASFNSGARFEGATFDEGPDALDFTGARVSASYKRDEWPAGWHLDSESKGKPSVVRTTGP